MIETTDQRDLLLRYLFGEVSEREKERIEKEYFANDDLYDELLSLEHELIHEYTKEELSPRDRERFERGYLASPVKRQEVEFAKRLSAYTRNAAAAGAPLNSGRSGNSRIRRIIGTQLDQRWALAAGCVLATIVAAIVVVQYVKIKQQLAEARREVATLREEKQASLQFANRDAGGEHFNGPGEVPPGRTNVNASGETDGGKKRASSPTIATLTLRPRLVRGVGEDALLVIQPRMDLVRLRLELEPDDYKTYQAVLQTAEGKEVWRQPTPVGQRAKGSFVVLSLPARLLQPGDYLVAVSGVTAGGLSEDVGEYHFRASIPSGARQKFHTHKKAQKSQR